MSQKRAAGQAGRNLPRTTIFAIRANFSFLPTPGFVVVVVVTEPLLRVRSAKRRHQSLQSGRFWATSDCFFIRAEVLRFHVNHVMRRRPGGQLQSSSRGAAVKIFLASASYGIHTMCPNWERRREWAAAKRWDCLVVQLTSSKRSDPHHHHHHHEHF